ncbi:MAG: hypothetical protein ACI9TH_001145 [Kiritimatiellia bacterium]|jgi:hypothetical protein
MIRTQAIRLIDQVATETKKAKPYPQAQYTPNGGGMPARVYGP